MNEAYSTHGGAVVYQWRITKWTGDVASGEEKFRTCNDTMTGICMLDELHCNRAIDRLEIHGPGYRATYLREKGRMTLTSQSNS